MIDPPTPDEYAEYYGPYVAAVPSGDILDVLAAQRDELVELLQDLTDEQARRRYAAGKWSVKEIVGHLIDAERCFAVRAMAFARQDPEALPGFDEQIYVRNGGADERDLDGLLEEYRLLRTANVVLFGAFSDEAWTRRGTASGVEFTTRAKVWIVAGHQAHHTKVLRERYLDRG